MQTSRSPTPKSLQRFFEDTGKQYEVMWHLCEDQAEIKGIAPKAFAKLFTRDHEGAFAAMTQALTDFFQQTGKIELSSTIEKTCEGLTKLRSTVEKTLGGQKMNSAIDQIVTQADQAMDQALEKIATTDIWIVAGRIGIDPKHMTIRELWLMDEGRGEQLWDLSNSIAAAVMNSADGIKDQLVACNGGRPRTRQPLDYTKLNPYRQ